jgi:Uncharacterized component of anaerobic dehydrogenases
VPQHEEIADLALTAAGLLLIEPDETLHALLQQAGVTVSLAEIRQIFYDRLLMPQSATFLPPFEHVFRQGRLVSGIWHFPPARHDGGAAVSEVYARWGFEPTHLDICPLLRLPHVPADHLGFMLTFAGLLLKRPEMNLLDHFVHRHLDSWVDEWCELLSLGDGSGYLQQLAIALEEAVRLLRQAVDDR